MPIMRTRLPRVQVVPDTISASHPERAWRRLLDSPHGSGLSYNSARALDGAELYAELDCDAAVARGERFTIGAS